jgi:ankyrin repeat protein
LEYMKKELAVLKARDDSSSSVKSISIESRSSVFPGSTFFNSQTGSMRESPVRSEVSLLDADDDEEGPSLPEADGRAAKRLFSDEDFIIPEKMAHEPMSPGKELQYLHNSIRQGNRQLFDKVLSHTSGICVLLNHGDKYGRTALHLAALAIRVDMAEHLISKGAVVNAQDDDGETPLHLSENAAVTQLLLKKGRANTNIPNVDGICPLHLAVQRRDIGSVRALLRAGANVNNADNVRWFTPLHLVALPARSLKEEKAEEDIRPRIAQLLSGTYGAVEPDINYQDSEGNAPLHYAVQLEDPDASKLIDVFLDKGANPNIKNDRNQSPLHLLCHNMALRRLGVFQEILHSMLFNGADPNQQSRTGCTPLHLSLYHEDIESAVQLVFAGADLHVSWKKVSLFNGCSAVAYAFTNRFSLCSHGNGRPFGMIRDRPKF